MVKDIELWRARPACVVRFKDIEEDWLGYDEIVVGFGRTANIYVSSL